MPAAVAPMPGRSLFHAIASTAVMLLALARPATALEGRDLLLERPAERCAEPSSLRVEEGKVVASPLPAMVKGFAAGTTGGLGHRLLLVDSAEDRRPSPSRPIPPGTLRWAVETATQEGGGWIRFAPALSGQDIRLAATLRLGPNTTIDGGCAGVRLIAEPRITLLTIGVANVIVSGLFMTKDPYQDAVDRTGDAVSLTAEFDRVALLHNSFRHCGDGCADIVRRDRSDLPGRATVAFNRFENHNKVILIGVLTCFIDREALGCDAPVAHLGGALRPQIFVTLQANVFERTSQRHPKVVSNALVDMVNNLVVTGSVPYPEGRRSAVYGAVASDGGILLARSNVFASIDGVPGRLAVGPINALRTDAEPRDGSGMVEAEGNLALDGLRIAASPPLPVSVPPPAPVLALAVTESNVVSFVACLRRMAGPQGLGLAWPDACR